MGFTLAMVVCPLGTYFFSLNIIFGGTLTTNLPCSRPSPIYQFHTLILSTKALPHTTQNLISTKTDKLLGNSTWAGASAALMANVVLMGYVVMAFNEDQSEAIEAAEKESKKGK
jgi:hypothetical protein